MQGLISSEKSKKCQSHNEDIVCLIKCEKYEARGKDKWLNMRIDLIMVGKPNNQKVEIRKEYVISDPSE
jgi:hypothetical protein